MEKKNILVVDDDAMNLATAKHILEPKGHNVMICSDGKSCIQALLSGDVDLLLLDIEMPGMSGLEALSKIRETPSIADIKTIFLTASTTRENLTEALRLGALDFIRKPFKAEVLYERLDKVFTVNTSKDYVLAIDDEQINHIMVKQIFGIRYNIECALSGEEALSMMEEKIPDLILLDYHMPQMNGLEFMEKMFKNPKFEDVPVIFLTADEDPKTEVSVFKAGAMDYIRKPFIAAVALQRVNRILEFVRMRKALADRMGGDH